MPMPPRPSNFRMRYGPSQPSSFACRGGDRKLYGPEGELTAVDDWPGTRVGASGLVSGGKSGGSLRVGETSRPGKGGTGAPGPAATATGRGRSAWHSGQLSC